MIFTKVSRKFHSAGNRLTTLTVASIGTRVTTHRQRCRGTRPMDFHHAPFMETKHVGLLSHTTLCRRSVHVGAEYQHPTGETCSFVHRTVERFRQHRRRDTAVRSYYCPATQVGCSQQRRRSTTVGMHHPVMASLAEVW